MLALASVIVVTAFPLVLNRTPHQAAWWGGVLLIISLLAFIVAFLLAGFVTVGYLSPPPTCSSLSCTNGGIPCNLNYYIYGSGGDGDDDDDGLLLFQMDPNAAALTLKTNSSIGVCVRYDTAVPHEDDDGDVYTTLHPWVPNDDDDYDASLQQLLTDPLTQNKTLCMDVTNLLAVLGPNVDPKTLAVNLTGANITDLNAYVAAYDHLYNSFNASIAAVQQLWAYPDLPYFCLPNNTASIMKFSTLCDRTPNTVSALGSSTSVSNTGSYIMASTSASVGAVIFSNDTTAQQVSMAIKTLAGVFALILVIIVIFLVKSKWL